MGENGELRLCLQLKMNISIVNALWVILTGERLDLEDSKLKVQYVLNMFTNTK